MLKKSIAFITFFAGTAGASVHGAVPNINIDFTDSGDADLFNANAAFNTDPGTWSEIAGTGGNGGFSLPEESISALVYNQEAFSVNPGGSITVSGMFRTGAPPDEARSNDVLLFGVGLEARAEANFEQSPYEGLIAAELRTGTTIGQVQMWGRSAEGSSGSNRGMTGSATLQENHWYRLTSTFEKAQDDPEWMVTATLDDYGMDGLEFQQSLISGSASLTGHTAEAAYNTDAHYAGLFGRNRPDLDMIPATEMDNFSVIPEPGTYALILGGGVMLLLGARRMRVNSKCQSRV